MPVERRLEAVAGLRAFSGLFAGTFNEAALRAAKEVADGAPALNIIVAAPGMGKTHMLEAVEREIRLKRPSENVLRLDGPTLALALTGTESWRGKARFVAAFGDGPDALLIDEAQLLLDCPELQYYFSFVLDRMKTRGKPVLLAASELPKNSPRLDDRLKRRFLAARIEVVRAPAPTELQGAISFLCAGLGLALDDGARVALHKAFGRSIGEMSEACVRLYAKGRNHTRSTVTAALQLHGEMRTDAADDVLERTARAYGVTKAKLMSPSRERRLAHARFTAMFLLHRRQGWSLERLGALFKRDHSSVLHGVQRAQLLLDSGSDSKLSELSAFFG